ncbi:hypothetical protein AB0N99_30525 [Streptomyces sp. NPDC093272]|uniref:hypothetical protein n=1 Tax=Streptomyces sp. NPDC093272 TaxID=3154981 RepID=UPI0034202154
MTTTPAAQQGHMGISPLGQWCLNQAAEDWPGIRLVIGVLAAALLGRLACRGLRRAVRRIAVWRRARRGLHLLHSYANSADMRTTLDHCHQARKETPQP